MADYDVKTKGTVAVALELRPGAQGLSVVQDKLSNSLWILMGVVALVVLIACCNLASLLLARAATRTQEIGIRLAIGATRGRLIRQFLTESLLLSAIGGCLGVAISDWGSRELVRLTAAGQPWRVQLDTDWRVVAFASALSVLTACVFGLIPAINATLSQPSMERGLRDRNTPLSSRRTAKGFVVAQMAISLVLLAGAFLLGRSFWNLTHQDFGYRPDGVVIARLPFDLANFKLTRDAAASEALDRRMNSLPGVSSAGLAGAGPLGAVQRAGKVALPERPAAAGEETRFVSVSPRYFETMGISVVTGRSITDMDRRGSPRVAVISETAARRIFGRENPVGRTFTNGDQFNPQQSVEIVGVVHDLRFADPREPFGIVVYQSLQQSPAPLTSIVVRTGADPALLVKTVEQALREAAPGLKVTEVLPLRQILESSLGQERMMARLSAALGMVALLIAAVGLYGVTAYGIAQRTKEIGVRLALGASPRRVLGGILREVGALLAVGLVAGCMAVLVLGRVIRTFLFGLTPQDPLMLLFAGGLLVAVAMLAGYLAARHAVALEPVVALHHG